MKKLLAFITALVLLSGIFQIPEMAFAEEKTPITVKQAIEIAKSNLGIKTEGYEFSSSYLANRNGYNLWALSWKDTKTNTEAIDVAIDADEGKIVGISWWTPIEQSKYRMPKYSKEEAIKAAQEIILKLQGDKLKQIRLVEDKNNSYYSKMPFHNFKFSRVYDGIALPEDSIQVLLDKNTLKLRGFYIGWTKGNLPSKANAMSIDKAKQIFREKLGLELAYSIIHNKASNQPSAVLTYTLKNKNLPIDAKSGELLNSFIIAQDQPMDAAPNSMVIADSNEQAELVKNNKYVPKEEAAQAVRDYIKIEDNLKLERADLHLGLDGQNTFWALTWEYSKTEDNTYRSINAQVDAVTKEVINFKISDSSYSQKGGKAIIEKDQAKKLAEDFLKKIQPDKFMKTEAREYPDSYYGFIPYNNSFYRYSFIRVENGIPCPGNSLYITVNAITGEITSYSTTWTELNFPGPDNAITLDKAYETLYNKVKFEMQYIEHYRNIIDSNSGELRLAYVLENSPIIDAKKGVLLSGDGTPIITPAQYPEYTDIKGNKAEKAINILTEMEILKPDNTKFLPNSKILQKEFIKLLIDSMNSQNSQPIGTVEYDSYYNIAVQRKIITASEKKPEAYVSRQDAARMIIRAMGYGAFADRSSIFTVNFKDASKIAKANRGYAVVASEFMIIPAIKSYFYPTNNISKGDAAEFMVNFLKCQASL